MGVREIRYCDISGTEADVESHELNIDQMHIQIDLAGPEYQKLLELLQPYIDAGRVEASVPARSKSTGSRQAGGSSSLSAEERSRLRKWAAEEGIPVAPSGRIRQAVVEQWREATGTAAANS